MQNTIRSIPEARLTGMTLAEQSLTWPITHDQVCGLLQKLEMIERLGDILECMLLSCADGIASPSALTFSSQLVREFVQAGTDPGQFGHWLGSHMRDGGEHSLASARDVLAAGMTYAEQERLEDDPGTQPYVIALSFMIGILDHLIECSSRTLLHKLSA